MLEHNYSWKRNLRLIYPVIRVTSDDTGLEGGLSVNIFGQITFDGQHGQDLVTSLLLCTNREQVEVGVR